MQLNPTAFNSHLAQIGQRYHWRRAYACPCVNANSGAARPGCLRCSGRGRIWNDPVGGVAGMAGSKVQQRWAQHGSFEDGDVVVTIGSDTPMYEMGRFDRVIALDSTDQFSLLLMRGANDRLQVPIASIDRVFWLDTNEAIVEGGIPHVAPSGALTWSSGAPPAGRQYSISGTRYNEFFCFGQLPDDRNLHSGARLPRRVVLRKFDLYGRAGGAA